MIWFMENIRCWIRDNPNVYAYTRKGEGENILVVLNFTSHGAKTNINMDIKNATMLLSNYENDSVNSQNKTIVSLRPYEAIIYKL